MAPSGKKAPVILDIHRTFTIPHLQASSTPAVTQSRRLLENYALQWVTK